MQKVWTRIHKYLEQANPDLFESLRAPAEAQAIADAEQALGVSFPDEFVQSLRLHDGQNDEALHDYWQLLPLAQICENAQTLRSLLESGDFDELETTHDKKVGDGWWRVGWIPILGDGYGNFICLDLDPGAKGQVGQLIVFWHDDAERKLESRGFKAFLQKVARELPKVPSDTSVKAVTLELDSERKLFRNPKQAQITAVRGDWQLARRALQQFHEQGNASAGASLIYLEAFLGNWQFVLEHAAKVVSDTEEFYHMNVPFEIASLVSRAGAETGNWQAVAAIAKVVPKGYGNARPWLSEAAQARRDCFLERRTANERTQRSPEENAALWAKYEAQGVPSTYSQNEASRRRHRFLMAVNYQQRAMALDLMQQHPEACEFQDVLQITDWFEPDQAWTELISRLGSWRPVYYAQIAPADLLTRAGPRACLTDARCRQVLSTPRAEWWWNFRK